MRYRVAVVDCLFEAATPVISAKCFRKTLRPDFDAPIGDQFDFEPIITRFFKLACEFVR